MIFDAIAVHLFVIISVIKVKVNAKCVSECQWAPSTEGSTKSVLCRCIVIVNKKYI